MRVKPMHATWLVGVAVSTTDSESVDRGSNPRRASAIDPSLRESHIVWRRILFPELVCFFLALETVFIVAEFNGVHSSGVRGTACVFCSASHTLSGDAGLWGSPPFCFFWHRRERDRVFILRG